MNKSPFRVRDKITGLYYCPSREIQVKDEDGYGRYVKSNLSTKGKVYFQDPRNHIKQFYDHTRAIIIKRAGGVGYEVKNLQLRDYIECEWEIEEFK
jgi:hypothetical protein